MQIKQILFIDPSLYVCTQEEDKDHNMDILIDLPPKADLMARRLDFKEKMYQYLLSKGAFRERADRKVGYIPVYKWKFE